MNQAGVDTVALDQLFLFRAISGDGLEPIQDLFPDEYIVVRAWIQPSLLLKIYAAEKEMTQPPGDPGHWGSDGKTYLRFACTDGYLRIEDLQLEGKKRMKVADFLRGYRFQA